MRRIREPSASQLQSFVVEAVEAGSTVHTDGWAGYNGLEAEGYPHEVTVLAKSKESASELLPRVHRVASLLKRWLMGTHQGAVSNEHLDYYLDEFTFRFNRRRSRHRGKLFYRLIQQAVVVEPLPYKRLIAHARGRKPHNHKI
jgi:transposase-like protein